ncbi:hypothetical protein Mame01_52380 [Microbispora amethystogenes]|nr:hypothetical protein Mame01_52380 [Microbispora amethystogenes]
MTMDDLTDVRKFQLRALFRGKGAEREGEGRVVPALPFVRSGQGSRLSGMESERPAGCSVRPRAS